GHGHEHGHGHGHPAETTPAAATEAEATHAAARQAEAPPAAARQAEATPVAATDAAIAIGRAPATDPAQTATSGRHRWYDRRMGWDARRVIGVDVACGLAMLGMFGAHLHVQREVTVADPGTWLGLVHCRSAIG